MRAKISKVSLVLGILAASVAAMAQNATIRLTSYPAITVADGRSTITVSAQVRDRSGRLVADGTQVVFTSTLGFFNEPVVKTNNGIARAIFSGGSIPGTAKIQASALAVNAVATLDVELVSDRSLLSTAKEYIEITAPQSLMYSMDQRIIGASGVDRAVTVRFRDIEIHGDDIQVSVPTYELRARKAKLKFGKVEAEFDELYFVLNTRKGYGTTTIEVPNYSVVGSGSSFAFRKTMKKSFGMGQISTSGILSPESTVSPTYFEFADLLDSTSTVTAKKAVAFPKGHIQFHKAELFVGETRVMKVPLYEVNMYSDSPVVTEQIVNVYDSQISVNYPYYLSLRPGETSLFRLTSGQRYGRSTSGSSGLFLDYELNWNRGDDMDGGLTISGLTRSDWGVGLRQYWRMDPQTVVTAQVDMPAHRSLSGSASLNRQLGGYNFSFSANSSRSIRGTRFDSSQLTTVLEKDPSRLGNLPIQMFYGVTATSSTSRTEGAGKTSDIVNSQDSVGVRSRFQLIPQQLDRDTSLSASAIISKQSGKNVNTGLTTSADVSLSRRFGPGTSISATYSYVNDGFRSSILGMQNVSFMAAHDAGAFSLSLSANRSLDIDRHSLFLDTSFKVSSLWRFSYSMTLDQYLQNRYIDDIAMLSYRIGVREIGVSYSIREKRLGFQLFGASLY